MTGAQTFVGAGGAALVLVNFWTGEARSVVSGSLFSSGGNSQQAHSTLVVLGGELLFVAVAALLAGLSDGAGTAMSALVVALFVLWAVNHFGGAGSPAAQNQTPTAAGPTGVVKGAVA
jgi:hypothetical protein